MKKSVRVPATIGNVGPGFDVLGLCVDGLYDTITGTLVNGPSRILSVKGADADRIPFHAAENVTTIAAEAVLRSCGDTRGIEIEFDRQLPLAGGLGSSAAAAVGGALLAASLLETSADSEVILEAALAGESAVAGRHLDNIAPCLFGGLCVVQSVDPPRIKQIRPPRDWHAVLVRQDVRISTKDARALLPKQLSTSQWTHQMSHCAALVAAFASNDVELARHALVDFYAEPARKHLIPHFDDIQKAALKVGAIGCTISGAGPTMFALSVDRKNAVEIKHELDGLGFLLQVDVVGLSGQGATIL